jgi:hypothetical protein
MGDRAGPRIYDDSDSNTKPKSSSTLQQHSFLKHIFPTFLFAAISYMKVVITSPTIKLRCPHLSGHPFQSFYVVRYYSCDVTDAKL